MGGSHIIYLLCQITGKFQVKCLGSQWLLRDFIFFYEGVEVENLGDKKFFCHLFSNYYVSNAMMENWPKWCLLITTIAFLWSVGQSG